MLYTFLRDTLRFFGNHWVPLVVITVGLGAVFEVGTLVIMSTSDSQFPWPAWVMQWLGSIWAMAAVILYLDAALRKQYLTPGKAISQGLVWVPMLAILQLVVGLAVGVGIFLLIVPGIYFAVKLVLAGYFLVLDRQSLPESLKLAWTRSDGYGWTLFGGYALIYGVMILVTQIAFFAIGVSEPGEYGLDTVLLNLLFKPVAALAMVFGFRIYTDSQQSS